MRKFSYFIFLSAAFQTIYSPVFAADAPQMFYGQREVSQAELAQTCPTERAAFNQSYERLFRTAAASGGARYTSSQADHDIAQSRQYFETQTKEILRAPDADVARVTPEVVRRNPIYTGTLSDEQKAVNQTYIDYTICTLAVRNTMCLSAPDNVPIPCHANANIPPATIAIEENKPPQIATPQVEAKPPEPEIQESRPVHTPPHLEIVHKNTSCLDARIENAIENVSVWQFEIVMSNSCASDQLYLAEMQMQSSVADFSSPIPFVNHAGWQNWAQHVEPKLAFIPFNENGETLMPISANSEKRTTIGLPIEELRPVYIWLASCDAKSADGIAQTMFKASSQLSNDPIIQCLPNVAIPN